MKKEDFQIGTNFIMGGNPWRCTDIGTRTICAIQLNEENPRLYNGPPYSICEYVIDEYDMVDCCETLEEYKEMFSDFDKWKERGNQCS